ncbi:substrate-binding domain-containing protein, partial [Acinetobacter nosocomialis]|nr:substrate-binding domain-containing protein [Acinetobacter nosocomialis]
WYSLRFYLVVFGASSLVKEKIEQGHLVQLDFKNTKNHLPLSIYLIWLQDKPLSKAARELVQMIQANLSHAAY